MSTELRVPALGIGVTEATLGHWLVADGDAVQAGQALYLLETDKAENEVEAPIAGTITLIGVEGDTYPVGTVIADIS